jgi:phosphatidylglycerophosphate synthase
MRLNLIATRIRFLASLLAPADLISASRFMFAGLWLDAFARRGAAPELLIPIALAAAISDAIDGPVARRRGAVHAYGRWLDNISDVFFALTALGSEAYTGALPLYVPFLVFASFAQYAVDSVLLFGSSVPVRSRVGHWGGIVNFGLVLIFACATCLPDLALAARHACPFLAIFYIAGCLERTLAYPGFNRLWARFQLQSTLDWRAAENKVL